MKHNAFDIYLDLASVSVFLDANGRQKIEFFTAGLSMRNLEGRIECKSLKLV
jgi:hypothetical protein